MNMVIYNKSFICDEEKNLARLQAKMEGKAENTIENKIEVLCNMAKWPTDQIAAKLKMAETEIITILTNLGHLRNR